MTGKVRKRRKAQPAKATARSRPAKGLRNKGVAAKSVTKNVAKAAHKRPPAPANPADVVETLVAAFERELKLPIAPAWRASVKSNLRVILLQAALVDQFPLPDEIEPAPVFRA
jgi:hypothetical protein